jgi:hypothetical protein
MTQLFGVKGVHTPFINIPLKKYQLESLIVASAACLGVYAQLLCIVYDFFNRKFASSSILRSRLQNAAVYFVLCIFQLFDLVLMPCVNGVLLAVCAEVVEYIIVLLLYKEWPDKSSYPGGKGKMQYVCNSDIEKYCIL